MTALIATILVAVAVAELATIWWLITRDGDDSIPDPRGWEDGHLDELAAFAAGDAPTAVLRSPETAYRSRHHDDTVRIVPDWYHPVFGAEFAALAGSAWWKAAR